MANVRPGQPYTPDFLILDANGSPVTAGVSGTLVLDSPSATGATSGAIAYQGGGRWGYTIAGTFTTGLGDYVFSVASLVTPNGTLTNQRGTFTVGVGDEWTMREALVSVRLALRDGWTGTTDASGSTTTLKCADFAYGSANDWTSSEILLLEPQAVADRNPVRVTGFAVSGGTFTFTPAITATVSGLDFIVGNKDGEGFGHAEVWDAILTAVRRRRAMIPVSDQITIATVPLTYEYSVPVNWARVDRVYYQPQGGATTLWVPVDRPYWSYRADRGLLGLTNFPANCALRIEGRAIPQVPEALHELVPGDGAAIRDDALYELLKLSDDPHDNQRAAMMQGDVMHARAGAALGRL